MTIEQAAVKLGWSAEFLRAAARHQRIPFCIAVQKNPKKSARWCYKVNEIALAKYLNAEFTWEGVGFNQKN